MQKSGLKNKYKAGEMARWIKHFPGKSEDVSSNPKNPCKHRAQWGVPAPLAFYSKMGHRYKRILRSPCASASKKDPV